MNNVYIIGRTTKDIVLSATSSGKNFVKFTIAVNRPKREDGTRETDFIPCAAWGVKAELLSKYVKKGDQIAVNGEIRTGSYEKDGKKNYTVEVNVTNVEFLTKREEKPEAAVEETDYFGFNESDDIPF